MASTVITELSYPFGMYAPVFPTNPKENHYFEMSIGEGDAANISTVLHHLHNGSHVDAPMHFCLDGKGIDEIPIEHFYYESPLLLSLPKEKGMFVTLKDLTAHAAEIEKADLLLLYLHYADLREANPAQYFDDFPALSYEAARYLRRGFPNLKGIAIDTGSIESCVAGPRDHFPVHHELLDHITEGDYRTLLIYEDMNCKAFLEVADLETTVCAFPTRWIGAEAAAVNMVALSKRP